MNLNKQLLKQKPRLLLYVSNCQPKVGWLRNVHSHHFCEIMFVKKGNGKVLIQDKTYPFCAGDIVIYNPNVDHVEYVEETNGNPLREMVFLGIERLNIEGFEHGCLCEGTHNIIKSGSYFDQFSFYLDQLLEEKKIKAVQYSVISDNILNIIISYIIRLSKDSDRLFEDKETYSHIKEYIDNNYTSIASIDDICKTMYINKYYLSHLFKDTLGIPPLKYMIQKRIESAKYLLDNTDDKIDDIAQKCGYMDAAYFGRVFKKVTGMTPLAYKKRGPQTLSDNTTDKD